MKRCIIAFLSLGLLTLPSAQAQQAAPAPARTITVTHSQARPSQAAPAEHFTGAVRIVPLFSASAPARTSGGAVTFAPGARSDWHTHPFGQTLIVTAGVGRVQSWGGPIQEIRTGDVVQILPGVKHWHGASPTSSIAHTAIQEETNGSNVTWLEKVSDQQYGTAPSATPGANNMNKEPSRAQQLIGDFSPKMVELTDNVLFGDIWERPELSKRDRSLITVAALIAGGNTEQLPGHLARAKENGVTEPEIVEVITHLAFYSGWPKAMSAISVAKKVFEK